MRAAAGVVLAGAVESREEAVPRVKEDGRAGDPPLPGEVPRELRLRMWEKAGWVLGLG